jgi:ribosomal-protein-alanine N-acetyltransferase
MRISKAKIYEIKNLAKVEMSSGYHKKKFNFEPYLKELFEKNVNIFYTKEKAVISGYITLDYKGVIDYLSVSKKHQGRGVASFLLKKAIYIAKSKKLKKLYLEVKNDNIPAIRLYLKNGFIITSTYEKKLGDNKITKLRMEKLLM